MLRLLAFALCVAGCDTATVSCPGDPMCPGVPPVALPDTVAGVPLAALFAPPTDAERAEVARRVDRAPATAVRVASVALVPLRTDPDATRFVRLDLLSAGGETLAYALARIPAVDGGDGGRLRTVVWLPEAPGDVSEDAFLTGMDARGLDRQAVQIVLAFRGATLTARSASGETVAFTSPAAAEPYRTEVADLLALTERLGDVPRADPSRLAAIGIGRGGTAALLAAERATGRFGVVAPIGAPTSLFDATFRAGVTRLLTGGTRSRLPSSDVLVAPVLTLRSGAIGLAEARLRLLELSPVALAARLPAVIGVYADPDDVVPPSHLDRLADEGDGTMEAPRRFRRLDNTLHSELASSSEARMIVAQFILDNL